MDIVLILQSTHFIIVLLYGHYWKCGDIMQNKRSAMTRQQFRTAFFDLAESTPADKINVKLLCEKAGLNRSTFYLHYETIDDFIDEIEQQWIDEQIKILGKVGRDDNTIPFITDILNMIKRKPELYMNLLSDYRLIDKYVEKMKKHFHIVIEEPENINSDYFYEYMLLGSFAITRKWIKSGCKMPAEQFAEMMYSFSYGTTYGLKTGG